MIPPLILFLILLNDNVFQKRIQEEQEKIMADKKKRGSHLRIRTKLVIYFSVLLAIPILILGFYTYHQSKENFEKQSIITIENNLSGILNEMEARSAREATISFCCSVGLTATLW